MIMCMTEHLSSACMHWLHVICCSHMYIYSNIANRLGKSHETGKVSAHHVAKHSGEQNASSTNAFTGNTTYSVTWLMKNVNMILFSTALIRH